LTGTTAIDFGRWSIEADWKLKVDPGHQAVVGAEPQVGISMRGPLDQPKRMLDVTPMTAFLTLRAFEHESQRVDDLKAEIVERDRFQRELKRLRDLRTEREQVQKAIDAKKPVSANGPPASPSPLVQGLPIGGPQAAATQSVKPATPKPGAQSAPLPDLPPAVYIAPKPPIMPLVVTPQPAAP
jgi:hypothetical protein